MKIDLLRAWFLSQKRDLPWRTLSTPYAVFVSEIMLQQTQSSVVIPYFNRWMERFPTVQSLANAKEEEVLKLWEGLGYYSRARNLLKGAKTIQDRWQGNIPKEEEALKQIPGIGPYTVGAIRAFAFKEKAAAVDGNVLRVLSRFFAIKDDIAKSKTQQLMRELALTLLPDQEPWVIAEAWIELGALICKKVPLCQKCPLKEGCKAYKEDLTNLLPIKSNKVAITPLDRTVFIVLQKQEILLRRVPEGEIMAGLYEFPYVETGENDLEKFNIQATPLKKLPEVTHSFTRYRVRLTPYLMTCSGQKAPEGYFWAKLDQAASLPFSSGHRKIFKNLDLF